VKTTDYIKVTIDKFPKGYVFTYVDFITEVNSREAVIKALNRLASSNKIAKLSKGKFYKPEQSPFGDLEPSRKQVVKDLLEKDGKILGYITGLAIYNQLHFTTQVSHVIQIGRNVTRPALKRGQYKIRFIKQNNIITKENIPLLQLIDVIRFINKIPDTNIESSCKRLTAILSELDAGKWKTMIRLSMKYPPATRALLGSILERMNVIIDLKDLQKSLNPITKYKLGISTQVLSTSLNWNII